MFALAVLVFLSAISLLLFIKMGEKYKIFSIPNSRSLHKCKKVRGGGITFISLLSVFISFLWLTDRVTIDLFMMFSIGGLFLCLFGFLDDLYDIKASKKLIIQCLFSSWLVYWMNKDQSLAIEWLALSLFFVVWMINAYNFMDGTDGMAASGGIFFSFSALVILFINGMSDNNMILVLFALCLSLFPFLLFNLPPSRIFMGDSGSISLGYIFAGIILYTFSKDLISVWTWIVIFGYFFSDTTVTQILRPLIVKKWYKSHRSHAYQNLARIWSSHKKIIAAVSFFNICWLLPLALLTALYPTQAPFICIIAILPSLIVAIKYGPLFSAD